MTAKEKLLAEAPGWTDAQATAALRVVEAQTALEVYFETEANLSPRRVGRARGRAGGAKRA